MMIAVERYISIVWPLRHHVIVSKRNAVLIIVCLWIYGFIVGSLPLLGWNSLEGFYEQESTQVDTVVPCSPKGNLTMAFSERNTSSRYSTFKCLYQNVISGSYAGFMYPGHFVVMWIIMLILYGRIYLITRSKTSDNSVQNGVRRLSEALLQKDESPLGKKPSKRVKENWKAMKILAIIVGYFIFSWMGMVIWYSFLFKGFTLDRVPQEEPVLPYWFYNVSIILAFGNSVLNPFIYGLGHRSVRKAFLMTLSFSKARSLTRPSSRGSLTSQKIQQLNGSREIALMSLNRSAGRIAEI